METKFGAVSNWTSIDGPVHYVEFEAPHEAPANASDGPPIVFVHGLGGSYVNWLAVGSGLANHGRAFAVDLSGFGRTPPEERGSTVTANQRLLSSFITEVVGAPPVLIGNSMGGTVSILQASAEPASVAGVVLVGPAVPRVLTAPVDRSVATIFASHAIPGLAAGLLGRRLDRLGPEGVTRETMSLVCVEPERISEDLLDAAIEMRRERMMMPWAEQSLVDASRSLMSMLLRRRSFDSHIAKIIAPTLIVQGAEDRLVPEVNTRRISRLRPDWRYRVLEGVGHVPQLEVPELFVDIVGSWIAELSPSQSVAE